METEIIYLSLLGLLVAFALIIILRNKRKPAIQQTPNQQTQSQYTDLKSSILNPASQQSPIQQANKPLSEWSNFESQSTNQQTPNQQASNPQSTNPQYNIHQPQEYSMQGMDIGKTRIFKKTSFSLDIVLIATVFAGFLCFIYAYINPNGAILSLLTGSIMFVPLGVLIGGIFAGGFRVKILRRLTRRNYGFVKFLHSNRLIKTVIANLDKDIIRFGDGIYLVDKQSIKREGSEEPSSDYINEGKIKFEEGIPVIYYDIGDIMPIDFQTSQTPNREDYRLPSQVSATLNKEIAVEKAKIMKAFKSKQDVFILIMLAVMVIILYFCYSIYTGNKDIVMKIQALQSNFDNFKNTIINIPTGTNVPVTTH